MRAVGLPGVIVVLGAGSFVMQQSVSTGSSEASPQQQIDVISIRQQLLTTGHAEREYLASHGTFAILEPLEQLDLLPGGAEARGCLFTGMAEGTGFLVTAAPIDEEKADWPVLEIDESMRVVQREGP